MNIILAAIVTTLSLLPICSIHVLAATADKIVSTLGMIPASGEKQVASAAHGCEK